MDQEWSSFESPVEDPLDCVIPARPRSSLETWNLAGFVPDASFERFLMIAYDLEISTPTEIQRLIDTVGDLVAKLTICDQIRLSGFIKERLLRQMTEMQTMRQRNLELGKSFNHFLHDFSKNL
jgi:hypothetical protein